MFEMLKPMIIATLTKTATAMLTKSDRLTYYAEEHLKGADHKDAYANYMLRAGLWNDAAEMILQSLPK